MNIPDNDKNVIIIYDKRNAAERANKKVESVAVLDNQLSRKTEMKHRAP